jgi:hypothetical protein
MRQLILRGYFFQHQVKHPLRSICAKPFRCIYNAAVPSEYVGVVSICNALSFSSVLRKSFSVVE